MTKEEFVEFINNFKKFHEYVNNYEMFGIDLNHEKNPIYSTVCEMFELIINSEYTSIGVDILYWYVYGTKFGEKIYPTYIKESHNKITVEDIYDELEQYRK